MHVTLSRRTRVLSGSTSAIQSCLFFPCPLLCGISGAGHWRCNTKVGDPLPASEALPYQGAAGLSSSPITDTGKIKAIQMNPRSFPPSSSPTGFSFPRTREEVTCRWASSTPLPPPLPSLGSVPPASQESHTALPNPAAFPLAPTTLLSFESE